jgi:hypothetical protein
MEQLENEKVPVKHQLPVQPIPIRFAPSAVSLGVAKDRRAVQRPFSAEDQEIQSICERTGPYSPTGFQLYIQRLSKGLSSGGGEEWKPIQIADKNEISV